jgi:hypothetical protein
MGHDNLEFVFWIVVIVALWVTFKPRKDDDS